MMTETLALFTTADAEVVLGRKLEAGEASSIRKSLEYGLAEMFVEIVSMEESSKDGGK